MAADGESSGSGFACVCAERRWGVSAAMIAPIRFSGCFPDTGQRATKCETFRDGWYDGCLALTSRQGGVRTAPYKLAETFRPGDACDRLACAPPWRPRLTRAGVGARRQLNRLYPCQHAVRVFSFPVINAGDAVPLFVRYLVFMVPKLPEWAISEPEYCLIRRKMQGLREENFLFGRFFPPSHV